ncbi:hypothetical protein HN997_02580, partial [archaeon]|nr:hypothetical protein [archaeon]
MKDKIEKYFSGKKLYGDDFDKQQIIEWFKDEEEGYSGLITKDHVYEFHALNGVHGYSKLKNINGLICDAFQNYERDLIQDLDSLPIPDWDQIPLKNYWKLKYAHGPFTSKKYISILT